MMMRQLIKASGRSGKDVRFIYRARPAKPLRPLLASRQWLTFLRVAAPYVLGQAAFYLRYMIFLRSGKGKVLIIHPQTLGFGLTERLMRRWPPGKAYIYVLDSSYFCVRSYNHISGEYESCLRCLGGNFAVREEFGCKPWPVPDPRGTEYVETLFGLGQQGAIKFLSQNATQAALLKRHFGDEAEVDIVGLWGGGWTELFDDWREKARPDDAGLAPGKPPVIIIHSFNVGAKGASWFLDVARRLPEFQFVCPFPRGKAIVAPPDNVVFKSMTWETGLKGAIEEAEMVMVPSLWSAPIEGALVKSIVAAKRVATVENDSHFQTELPETLILRLPRDPAEAARELRKAITKNWAPDPETKRTWIAEFRARNEYFAERVLDRMSVD